MFFQEAIFSQEANALQFNTPLFEKEVEDFHLIDSEFKDKYYSITDTRKEIDSYIKYDNVFSSHLDEICNNIVGNTMVKLLLVHIKNNPESKFEIENSSVENSFCLEKKKLYMNLSRYNSSGIKDIPQCGINEKEEFIEKKSNITEGLFHELCHALHYISGSVKKKRTTLEHIYKHSQVCVSLWQGPGRNDEELYNITGFYSTETKMNFDPVNCNMFGICDSCQSGSPIIQRVFHKTFFVSILRSMQELRTYYKKLNIDILVDIKTFLIDTSKYVLKY
jgi:hypothetical protein